MSDVKIEEIEQEEVEGAEKLYSLIKYEEKKSKEGSSVEVEASKQQVSRVILERQKQSWLEQIAKLQVKVDENDNALAQIEVIEKLDVAEE